MPNTATDKAITDWVSAVMRDKGASQAAVAEVIGVTQGQVSARLRGEVAWKGSDVLRIAKHYGVTFTYPDEVA